jgi:hypothetical protein
MYCTIPSAMGLGRWGHLTGKTIRCCRLMASSRSVLLISFSSSPTRDLLVPMDVQSPNEVEFFMWLAVHPRCLNSWQTARTRMASQSVLSPLSSSHRGLQPSARSLSVHTASLEQGLLVVKIKRPSPSPTIAAPTSGGWTLGWHHSHPCTMEDMEREKCAHFPVWNQHGNKSFWTLCRGCACLESGRLRGVILRQWSRLRRLYVVCCLRASPTDALNFGAVKTVYSALDQRLGREAMFTSNRSSKHWGCKK